VTGCIPLVRILALPLFIPLFIFIIFVFISPLPSGERTREPVVE